MNRTLVSLTVATALTLGVTLCGTAKANIGDGHRFDHERFSHVLSTQFGRDALRPLDPRWFGFDHDEFRPAQPWWLRSDGDDLRYFEHRQFIADAAIPTG